jgi:hypothetical protein
VDHLGGDTQPDFGVAIDDPLLHPFRQILALALPHGVAAGVPPEVHLWVRHLLEVQLAHLDVGTERDVRVLRVSCALLFHGLRNL